jgi:hypothetical protein
VDQRLIVILVAVALFVLGLVYRHRHAEINLAISAAFRWLWKIAFDKKTCKLAEEFCLEAAVLWFVFPLLDSIYDPTKRGTPVLMQGYVLAVAFFLFAVILAHVGKEG